MTVTSSRPDNDRRNRSGLRLFRELGHLIEWVRGDEFLVPSRSRKNRLRHEVNLREMTCSCEDHQLGGHRCAHLIAAEIWIAKHLEAKRRRKPPRRERTQSPQNFQDNVYRMRSA